MFGSHDEHDLALVYLAAAPVGIHARPRHRRRALWERRAEPLRGARHRELARHREADGDARRSRLGVEPVVAARGLDLRQRARSRHVQGHGRARVDRQAEPVRRHESRPIRRRAVPQARRLRAGARLERARGLRRSYLRGCRVRCTPPRPPPTRWTRAGAWPAALWWPWPPAARCPTRRPPPRPPTTRRTRRSCGRGSTTSTGTGSKTSSTTASQFPIYRRPTALDSELERDGDILGDACDPNPCPDVVPVIQTDVTIWGSGGGCFGMYNFRRVQPEAAAGADRVPSPADRRGAVVDRADLPPLLPAGRGRRAWTVGSRGGTPRCSRIPRTRRRRGTTRGCR